MTVDAQWPILKQGSTGVDVTALQYLLRGATGSALAADGVFGPATKQTVLTFQNRVKITADGIAGPVTWGKLTDGVTVHSTVRMGAKGDFVKAAQTELLKRGYLESAADVDGYFGMKTDDGTREFQKVSGLEIDGVIGPLTWKPLISLPVA